MKKRSYKQSLRTFGWTYIFFAVAALLCAILVLLIPSISEAFKPYINDDIDPKLYLEIVLIVNMLIEIWYLWLSRRFVSGKSSGTFYMILLIIGVVGNLYSLIFVNTNMSTINLVLDAVALFFVLGAKKQEN